MRETTVGASRKYSVKIGAGLLYDAGAEAARLCPNAATAAIITDSNVYPLYLERVKDSFQAAGFKTEFFVFPAGEMSKSNEILLNIYSFLIRAEITRGDIIVALGGGVVGDITGFAAATFNRGVPFIQLPTTLLAAVDSSVGGKTAVNLPEGKNLVGAFNQPVSVLFDTDTLKTLPEKEIACGMGEIIKYGMIDSPELFDIVKNGLSHQDREEVIFRCVAIKSRIVQLDEFDTGLRMLLNFGHTIGHAIEKYYNYQGISHGEAVAAGMAVVTAAAQRHGLSSPETTDALFSALMANGLPCECGISSELLFELSQSDKKRIGSRINVIIATEIGKAEIVPMEREAFRKFITT